MSGDFDVDWAPDAPPWVCTNCGFWQRLVAAPPWCPLCLDPRHAPPRRGWDFRPVAEIATRVHSEWDEVEPGLWRFGCAPPVGIGGSGYLVQHEAGNVVFEAPAWLDDPALAQFERLGGVAWATASHPHTYGALWRLQERFGCEVALHVADLDWTGAFSVTWPWERTLQLAPGLALHHTGGHFAGHAALHDAGRRVLLCGDALKLDLDPHDARCARGIATHKGYVRGIPLTTGELREYREVFAALAFDQAWTPFEQGANVDRAAVLGALDRLLAGRPTIAPVPLPGIQP